MTRNFWKICIRALPSARPMAETCHSPTMRSTWFIPARSWNTSVRTKARSSAFVSFIGWHGVPGSSTAPEYSTRTVDNLLGTGDFVTGAPDGEAFAQMRFGSPQSFERIVHTYLNSVSAPYRIRKGVIQTSDDGKDWTDAVQAEER